MQLGSMFISNCNITLHVSDAKSVRNMYSNITVTNKHTAKLHHVGSLYILTYDARKLKHKKGIKLLQNDAGDNEFSNILHSIFIFSFC